MKSYQAIKSLLITAIGSLLFFSCSMNLLNDHLIKTEPYSDVIVADELADIGAVSLSWNEDPGADSYVVMKSVYQDEEFVEFQPVYKGEEQIYIDRDLQMAVTYAYRLDKIKSDKLFEGYEHTYYSRSAPAPGVLEVRSINDGLAAYLSWEPDNYADKYIIMRTEAGKSGMDFDDEYVTRKTELVNTYSYIDNTINVEKTYGYRLDKVCGNQVFKGKEVAFFEKTRPDPFPDVIVAQKLNNGKAAYLTWKTDPGADKYRVMRALNDGSILVFSERINGSDGFQFQGSTSATDSNLLDNKNYSYRLDKMRGKNDKGEDNWITGLEVTVFSRTRPDPFPDVIIAQKLNDGKAAYLTWKNDPGADKYRVMRALNNGSPLIFVERKDGADGFNFQGITSAMDSSLLDDQSYFYRLDKMQGKNDKGEDNWIIGLDVTLLSKTRPDPFPDVIVAQKLNDGKAAHLSWRNDPGADKYRVMRALDEGSIHTFIERKNGLDGFNFQGSTSAMDSNLQDDKSYLYRLDKMRGKNDKGEDNWIIGLDVTVVTKTRPDPFADVIVAQNFNNGKSAYLTWKDDPGADRYRVMRALNNGGALIFVERNDKADGFNLQGSTSAIDSNLQDDQGYLYRLDKMRGKNDKGEDNWIVGLEVTVFSLTRPLPYTETPVVTSFREDGYILVSWSSDEGADSYILTRSLDNPPISNLNSLTEVYRGTATQFLDKTVQEGSRYGYRLFKIRNSKSYPAIESNEYMGLGVSVRKQEDKHEPNNTEVQATLLEVNRVANLYCYRFTNQAYLEDVDWYKVSIPPWKKANIVITYSDVSLYDEWFEVYKPNGIVETIIHSRSFYVSNDSGTQQYIAFAIRPRRAIFVPSGTGGHIVSYTITLQSIE